MTHVNPSDDQLRTLLSSATTIALVGASNNLARPAYSVMERLLAHGYRVIPVNPGETEVLGQPAVPTLAAAKELAGGKIDIVNVFRRSTETPAIADDAVAIGAHTFWLQSGIVNETAAQRAKVGGLEVVMDLCLSVELSLLSVPRKA